MSNVNEPAPLSADNLKQAMPLLARHEGVWEGWYRYFDAQCEKKDEHRSRLVCRFPDGGPYPYHQTNYYRWEDGKTEIRDFPAYFRNGRLEFDSDLIEGWAADVALDDFKRTTMLNWVRRGEPDLYLYEMIQISDCGDYRHRIWHWYRAGRLVERTLIDEHRVAHDWRAFEADNPTF
ncbi:MAG: DUF3598 domain-containing protein [Pseudomonadota bacterium]